MQQESSTEHSAITINHLPPHLQHLIFASAAAPLTTCKASAALPQDPSLVATWLLVKHKEPLLTAVQHRLWDACQQLLGTHCYKPCSCELASALESSAGQGGTAVVQRLLEWCCHEPHDHLCCDVCSAVWTAFHNACDSGHQAVVELMIRHPAITAQDVRSAVRHAAQGGQVDMLELLMSSRPDAASPQLKGAPMNSAAASGQHEAMQLLMQHGADINGRSGTPWSSNGAYGTPLEGPAIRGHTATVTWMLGQGADATAALAASVSSGKPAIVRLLLDQGADISVEGPSAVKAAIRGGHLKAAQLLLAAGTPDYFMGMVADCDIDNYLSWVTPDQADTLQQTAVKHGHVGFATMLKRIRTAPHNQV
jgi:ankyrin repeat protein